MMGIATVLVGVVSLLGVFFTFFIAPFYAGFSLALLQEWTLVGVGIGYVICLRLFLIRVLLLPTAFLVRPSVDLLKGGKYLAGSLMNALHVAWRISLIGSSCALAMWYASEHLAHNGPRDPYIIWAFTVTLIPWFMKVISDEEKNGIQASPGSFSNIMLAAAGWSSFIGIMVLDRTGMFEIALPIVVCSVLSLLIEIFWNLDLARDWRKRFPG